MRAMATRVIWLCRRARPPGAALTVAVRPASLTDIPSPPLSHPASLSCNTHLLLLAYPYPWQPFHSPLPLPPLLPPLPCPPTHLDPCKLGLKTTHDVHLLFFPLSLPSSPSSSSSSQLLLLFQ